MSIDDEWADMRGPKAPTEVDTKAARELAEEWADQQGLPEKLYYLNAGTHALAHRDQFYIREVRPVRKAQKGHMQGYVVYVGEFLWGPVEKPADPDDGRKWVRRDDCYSTYDRALHELRRVAAKFVEFSITDIKSQKDNIERYQRSLEHCRQELVEREAFLAGLPTPRG